ncbi:amino acid ABC transporter permease [uncultured Olegusella sp.]|uniref:amino acid ABC transporter permease n=1 Tax=uncultured Olegusella sp. TaxID=1979846 RepID=UPI0026331623|nr:amino acid ABC transporter permease [uncultured Olegusella sp.]
MEVSIMFQKLIEGYGISLEIFFVTLIGATLLAIPVALGRLSRIKPLAWLISIYISLMRGTPLMLQMFAVFFAPYYVFGITMGPGYMMVAVLASFVINYAAYFAEIYRSGIQSMPRGQYEAAEALGYSRSQTFFRIILPQVVKRILPAMGNEIVTLVKDTSLAFSIGVIEMFTTGKALVAREHTMIPFVIAAAIYWITCLIIEALLRRAEKKLAYYHD